MNENYNKCGCECVEPSNEPTIQNLVVEVLNLLDMVNEQLSSISETLYGKACVDPQKREVKCLNDAMLFLLSKAHEANDQACRIRAGLS